MSFPKFTPVPETELTNSERDALNAMRRAVTKVRAEGALRKRILAQGLTLQEDASPYRVRKATE